MFKRFFKKIKNAVKKVVNTISNVQNKVINFVVQKVIAPVVKPVINYWAKHDPYVFPALKKAAIATQNFAYQNRRWLVPVLITGLVVFGLYSGMTSTLLSGGRLSTGATTFFSTLNTGRKIVNFTCMFCSPTLNPTATFTSIPTATATVTFTSTATQTTTFTPSPTNTSTPTMTFTPIPAQNQNNDNEGSGGGSGCGTTECPGPP